jgi:hypothetical protein
MKAVLQDPSAPKPFLVSLGDLGESKDCNETKQLFSGTTDCFNLVRALSQPCVCLILWVPGGSTSLAAQRLLLSPRCVLSASFPLTYASSLCLSGEGVP